MAGDVSLGDCPTWACAVALPLPDWGPQPRSCGFLPLGGGKKKRQLFKVSNSVSGTRRPINVTGHYHHCDLSRHLFRGAGQQTAHIVIKI